MDLLFSQKDGFVDYEPPERLQLAPNESWEDYVERVKLVHHWCEHRGKYQEYQERSYSSDYTPGSVSGYTVGSATGDEPRYRLELSMGSMGVDGSDWEVVWVKTRGDLLALRIQLAQLTQIEVPSLLADLLTLTKRTFRKDHEHSGDEVCDDCDPIENRARREEQKERRQKEAKERIFFILNQEKGHLFILHAKDQGEMEGHLTKLKTQDPQLTLAHSEQGTLSNWSELVRRFAPYVIRKPYRFEAAAEILAYLNQRRRGQPPLKINRFDRM